MVSKERSWLRTLGLNESRSYASCGDLAPAPVSFLTSLYFFLGCLPAVRNYDNSFTRDNLILPQIIECQVDRPCDLKQSMARPHRWHVRNSASVYVVSTGLSLRFRVTPFFTKRPCRVLRHTNEVTHFSGSLF